MDIITQNIKFRQSLLKHAEKHGVVIHIILAKALELQYRIACRAVKKPHSHSKQHTEKEIRMIRKYRRRNPELGLTELWHWIRKNGYTR